MTVPSGEGASSKFFFSARLRGRPHRLAARRRALHRHGPLPAPEIPLASRHRHLMVAAGSGSARGDELPRSLFGARSAFTRAPWYVRFCSTGSPVVRLPSVGLGAHDDGVLGFFFLLRLRPFLLLSASSGREESAVGQRRLVPVADATSSCTPTPWG